MGGVACVAEAVEADPPEPVPPAVLAVLAGQGGQAPLVGQAALAGRDADLAVIREFVADSSVRGQALLLSGEPGVGKSTLLDAAREMASAAGIRVLHAVGAEFEADVSFAGLNQVLLPLSEDLGWLSVTHRTALGVALGLTHGTQPNRLLVSNAALALLRQTAAATPLLVIVDDLPWIDRASSLVLGFVARRLADSRVGFLAAERTGADSFFDRGDLPVHEVRALDEAPAAGLLDAKFPSLAPRVRQRVLAEAQGNPLALLELPAELTGPQRAALEALPVALPLSRRLQALFTARADLPATTRYLLLLAVLEGHGDLAVVQAAAAGQHEIDDLAAAERAGLVRVAEDAGHLVFRHPLIRSAVMQLAASSDQRRAHRALATHFADDPERRAWHLAHAVVVPDEEVADQLTRLARRIMRRGDAAEGLATLLRAAQLSPRAADRSNRLSEAAYLGVAVTGEVLRVPQLLADARQGAPEPGGGLHASVAAAHLLVNTEGDVESAHRVLVDALAAQAGRPGRDDGAVINALHTLLMVCSFGDRPEMWAPFDAAVAHLGPRLPADLHLLAKTYADPVRTAAGVTRQLDAAISALGQVADPVRILTVSTAAFFTDRLAGCREALWRVAREGRKGGATAQAITALTLLGADGFMSGDWDAAQQSAEECLLASQASGCPMRAWMPRVLAALLAAARGDYGTAQELSVQTVQWALPRGIRQAQTAVRQVRTLAALGRGDFEEAYQEAAAISPPGVLASHAPYALRVAMDLVEAATRTGRHDEARAHVTAMREARIADISPRLDMLATASAALVAPAHEAGELFRAALAVPGADRWPFDFARVRLAHGEHLRRDRATTEARAQLGAAQATFRVLGAMPWAERADNELRAAGLHAVRAGGCGLPELTAQERQIASLAAAGLTNKEIGQRLYLSHRTVSGHLYQIFPKLGITSRAALRDALTTLSPGSRASS